MFRQPVTCLITSRPTGNTQINITNTNNEACRTQQTTLVLLPLTILNLETRLAYSAAAEHTNTCRSANLAPVGFYRYTRVSNRMQIAISEQVVLLTAMLGLWRSSSSSSKGAVFVELASSDNEIVTICSHHVQISITGINVPLCSLVHNDDDEKNDYNNNDIITISSK